MLYDTGSTVLNTISRKLQGEKSIYLKLDVKLRHFISHTLCNFGPYQQGKKARPEKDKNRGNVCHA